MTNITQYYQNITHPYKATKRSGPVLNLPEAAKSTILPDRFTGYLLSKFTKIYYAPD